MFKATCETFDRLNDGGLLFTNFIDFDQLYGHRRDVAGYAAALERFDLDLALFLERMRDDDLLVVTADHGCDPTWHGTEHTRERVPVLIFNKSMSPRTIGLRDSFCDVGETIADWLGIEVGEYGKSCL